MMVTPRSLRRRMQRHNPNTVKVATGIMASAVGMATAAFGVLHISAPFRGNGARTDAWESPPQQEAGPLEGTLMNILSLIPLTDPVTPDEPVYTPLFSLPSPDSVATPIIGLVDSAGGGNSSTAPSNPDDPKQPNTLLPGLGEVGPGLNRPGPSPDPGDGGGSEDPTLTVTPPDASPVVCPVADAVLPSGTTALVPGSPAPSDSGSASGDGTAEEQPPADKESSGMCTSTDPDPAGDTASEDGSGSADTSGGDPAA